jgi:hypothetical protein
MSNGNININIDKLPESPWFWLLVSIGVFLILLATNHVATAVVFFFIAFGIICLVANFMADQSSDIVWWIGGSCLVIGVILGLLFVPEEWRPKEAEVALQYILTTHIPV